MHRCHAAPERWEADGGIRLSARESHHLATVMRVPEGTRVAVFDGAGRTAEARVERIAPDAVLLRVLPGTQATAADGTQIILVQALPKGGRMDDIVVKCTEIGAAAIMPVVTDRCVARLAPDQAAKRLARWERLAVSAAKQCQTPALPAIAPVGRLKDIPFDLFDACLVATLAPGLVPLQTAIERLLPRRPARVAVVIGPEGDLTPDETAALVAGGAVAVTFGPNTLRTDTAAIYAVAVLTHAFRAGTTRAGS